MQVKVEKQADGRFAIIYEYEAGDTDPSRKYKAQAEACERLLIEKQKTIDGLMEQLARQDEKRNK